MIPRPRFPGAPRHSDARLVELARRGDERAFELIVRRHRASLVSYCRRLGLGDTRAEDAVQQAFLSAWLALCRGDEVRDLGPWLGRIAHNRAINALRSGAGVQELHPEAEPAAVVRAGLDERLALRHTLAAVAALPPRQRDALILSAVEGRSYEEVASALGVSPGAVRGLLHRARETLREGAGALTPLPLARGLAGWLRRGGGEATRLAATAPPGGGTALRAAAAAFGTVALATGVAVGPLHGLLDGRHRHVADRDAPRAAVVLPASRATAARRVPAATPAALAHPALPGSGSSAGAPQGSTGSAPGGGAREHAHPVGRASPVGGGGGGASEPAPAQEAAPAAAVASAPAGEGGSQAPAGGPAEQAPVTSQPEAPHVPETREREREHEEEPPEREKATEERAPPAGGEPESPAPKDN